MLNAPATIVKALLESAKPEKLQATKDDKIICLFPKGNAFRVTVELPKTYEVQRSCSVVIYESEHPFGYGQKLDPGAMLYGFLEESQEMDGTIKSGFIDIVNTACRIHHIPKNYVEVYPCDQETVREGIEQVC